MSIILSYKKHPSIHPLSIHPSIHPLPIHPSIHPSAYLFLLKTHQLAQPPPRQILGSFGTFGGKDRNVPQVAIFSLLSEEAEEEEEEEEERGRRKRKKKKMSPSLHLCV
jgi:hypothetical protein